MLYEHIITLLVKMYTKNFARSCFTQVGHTTELLLQRHVQTTPEKSTSGLAHVATD